jgi:hypothetical protein
MQDGTLAAEDFASSLGRVSLSLSRPEQRHQVPSTLTRAGSVHAASS